jgi:hypothetical protein
MVHLPTQAMIRKRAAAKQTADGQAREIGRAVDLGITVSIYGPHARFEPACPDHGVEQDVRSMHLSGPDTWTTEH